MKRFYCSTALKKKKREGKEGISIGWWKKKNAAKKELHFMPSLSHFCLFPFLPPHFPPGRCTVEPYQRPYRKFTGRCIKIFLCQWIVISRDAPHNGCQRCLEGDSCVSRCFAELSRSVCEGVGFFLCVSEPLCIIVRRSWPTACCFLWDVALSQRGVCFRVSVVIRPICRCIKELKSGTNFAKPWQCILNPDPWSTTV